METLGRRDVEIEGWAGFLEEKKHKPNPESNRRNPVREGRSWREPGWVQELKSRRRGVWGALREPDVILNSGSGGSP